MEKVKDAIDALREEFKRIPTTAIRATHRIEQLSSAQPEPLSDIDRMKYYVCCPMCDLPKCVKGAVQCEAEQWAQARRKEGEANG